MKKSFSLLVFLICSLLAISQYNPTPQTIDSITQLLSNTKDDSTKYELYYQLGMANGSVNINKSLQHYDEALEVAKKLKDKERMMNVLIALSFAYSNIGESPKAIDMLHQVLRYKEETKTDPSMALAFISQNYEAQGDYKNAIAYARRSFFTYEKGVKDKTLPFDPIGYVAGPMHMGIVFEKMNQLDSAFYYAQISYQRVLVNPDPYFFCQVCNLLGSVNSRLNNTDEAIRFYRLALAKAIEVNFPAPMQESQLAIANFYSKAGKPDSVIHYAAQAYEGAEKLKRFNVMKDAALLLRSTYEKQGIDTKALYYNDLSVAARDSVTGADKIREVQNLTFKEERRQEKIQQEIVAGKTAYQNRIKVYSLMGIIGAALIVAIILYRSNRQKHKANTLLNEQKTKIQKQHNQLEHSLSELKSTQAQLIQSEKMASLGELTAGIAHEIQNPLNFVNNFSEVNKELIEELKSEKSKVKEDRNEGLEDDILNDISSNLEKISHHGKRADAIVKGMLQHSQVSIGQKEPTDINALADEYLRLSFHGIRAKEKNFNATLQTDFDNSIGNINIIPQDIGRVLLNLYNNAFYAVNERLRQAQPDSHYKPSVSIVTKKINDKVEIRVKDNGNGIPQNIVDKIFQPFFTTKPTGQGTGLGLSLSYDIIKAHGGEIKVESKEGEFTEFVVWLSD